MSNPTREIPKTQYIHIDKNGARYRIEHGIDFKNADGDIIHEVAGLDSDAAVDVFLEDDDNWPDGSVRCTRWTKDVFVRWLERGVDYGRGSVKQRFGGGFVPRAAYQFRGGNHG